MGLRDGLDGSGKARPPHRDSNRSFETYQNKISNGIWLTYQNATYTGTGCRSKLRARSDVSLVMSYINAYYRRTGPNASTLNHTPLYNDVFYYLLHLLFGL